VCSVLELSLLHEVPAVGVVEIEILEIIERALKDKLVRVLGVHSRLIGHCANNGYSRPPGEDLTLHKHGIQLVQSCETHVE
jgi:hypothetical protein